MAALLHTISSIKLSNMRNANQFHTSPLLYPLTVSFTRRRLMIRATETDANEVKGQAPDKAPSNGGSSLNQLLGIKGTTEETNKWKIHLQLTKPVTWPPLVWGVVCGAAASVTAMRTINGVPHCFAASAYACMQRSNDILFTLGTPLGENDFFPLLAWDSNPAHFVSHSTMMTNWDTV
ncbi:hypothetical protein Ancab_022382 [Ancistrocladus abbreviatus]